MGRRHCCPSVQHRYIPCGYNSTVWEECAAETIGHRSKGNRSLQFQSPDPEEPARGEKSHACTLSWRPARKCLLLQVPALRVACIPSVPVICHCSEVQAFRREAHRAQRAHVDIAVIHGRFQLGVTTKEKQRVWNDGPPPPESSPAGSAPNALACAPSVKPWHLQTGKQSPAKAPCACRCHKGYQHLC